MLRDLLYPVPLWVSSLAAATFSKSLKGCSSLENVELLKAEAHSYHGHRQFASAHVPGSLMRIQSLWQSSRPSAPAILGWPPSSGETRRWPWRLKWEHSPGLGHHLGIEPLTICKCWECGVHFFSWLFKERLLFNITLCCWLKLVTQFIKYWLNNGRMALS